VVRPRSNLWKAAACIGVVGVSGAIASRGVPDWEVDLFLQIHDVPRWVDYALWTPMQFGSAWAPPVAAATAWWVTKSWRPTAGALVAGWGGWWLAKGLKNGFERGRPANELGPDFVRPTAITDGLGFVSGHATVAFACAAVLSPYLSRTWRIAVYTLAATVALSRVSVGAHFPLDVVGGAALGLLLAYVWHLTVGIPATARVSA
jgi:membrane-associated phospholipid phosphatase